MLSDIRQCNCRNYNAETLRVVIYNIHFPIKFHPTKFIVRLSDSLFPLHIFAISLVTAAPKEVNVAVLASVTLLKEHKKKLMVLDGKDALTLLLTDFAQK